MGTPIDPTDLNELYRVFDSAVGFSDNAYHPHKGVKFVARAVCPEHHAVYDTRKFDLVPKNHRNHAEKVVE